VDIDITLSVATPAHIGLPSLTAGREAPKVGPADQFLTIHRTLLGKMRPLVRAAGFHDAHFAKGGPPNH
jgi:hypothetical protein|tara:strand:- start:140 stop:346 length:207 start_codon:yes stop_codon:yes gene_type:complete